MGLGSTETVADIMGRKVWLDVLCVADDIENYIACDWLLKWIYCILVWGLVI
jgi:hypothetical protein